MPLISVADEAVEVEPRRRRRPVLVVAVVVAITALLIAATIIALSRDEAAPEPDVTADAAAVSATVLAYIEFESQVRMAECLEERGMEGYPGLTAYRDRVSQVAEVLGVSAARPDSFARYLPRTGSTEGYADAMVRSIDDGGCMVWRPVVDLADDALVESTLVAARSDAAFGQYIADSLWADVHAAELAAMYLNASEPAGAVEVDSTAPGALAAAVSIAGSASTWRAEGDEVQTTFAQAWGSTVSGTSIVLRIEPVGVVHPGALWGSPQRPIVCGPLQVSLSTGTELLNYDGPRRGEVFDIHRALEESWCTALGEDSGVA